VATKTPHTRRSFPAIIVLLLVPLNGSIAYFHMLPKAAPFIIIAVIGILVAGALILRQHAVIHAALLTLLLAAWNIISNIAVWPSLIIPLIVCAGVVILIPALRRSVGWLRTGQFDKRLRALMLVTVIVSSTGLLSRFILRKPDLTRFLGSIPNRNPALLILEEIGFALLTAAMEESIFRGVLMQALDDTLVWECRRFFFRLSHSGCCISRAYPESGSGLPWQRSTVLCWAPSAAAHAASLRRLLRMFLPIL